ncbi:DUF1295 domain-containing protein [Glaciecola petra]|uniref:DUF1295 domain-containing protein n=1 Tax=Glaciecola petra TaxID=3075602 RepID=A0ABU2ZSH4_9ALTE|nr:DUF1295 domain-containing protein [Aestuariibacter sp. P117]MDT0595589.1 DUF1295 domain-containing protein [Aestuariibacter sp. P117]
MNSKLQAFVVLLICALLSFALTQATGAHVVQVFGLPFIAVSALLAFGIQWIAFLPAYIKQTERFYDITGSGTFILLACMSLAIMPTLSIYQWMLGLMVIIWALRLGGFLFKRIQEDGIDDRFEHIKPNKYSFFTAWTIQGLWVLLTSLAALSAITSVNQTELGLTGLIGFIVWLIGMLIESIADYQKRAFKHACKQKTAGQAAFIASGLWAYSRHPNYLGEILLWIGVAIASFPILTAWQHVVLISPVFVILLLCKISGIPLLESKAKKKWGEDPAYQAYKAKTPVLIPRLF